MIQPLWTELFRFKIVDSMVADDLAPYVPGHSTHGIYYVE